MSFCYSKRPYVKIKKIFCTIILISSILSNCFSDKNKKVDIDLTWLSGILVYSEVFNMMYEPENYVGKTVKMRGAFYAVTEELPEPVFACIIQDATACCAQGLEIRLSGNYEYPKDFPPLYSEIIVTGTFFYETDGWFVNIGLKDAVIID